MSNVQSQLHRAAVLMSQGRHDLAETHLREAIGADPDNDTAFARLGMCLAEINLGEEAERAARRAIELDPGEEFNHYALGLVLLSRGKTRDALKSAQQAIDLEPDDVNNWHLLGLVHLRDGRHEEAIKAAESGLAIDADDAHLRTLRATCLTRLGRPQAVDEADHALAADPQNEIAHANKGWALLHAGKPREAVEHFREALRLDPNYEHAREGIMEAMKARSRFYRPVLRYFMFTQRLSQSQQIGIVVGFVALLFALSYLRRAVPIAAPVIDIVNGLIFAACALVMFGDALFNLVLRADPLGRHALTPRQSRLAVLLGLAVVPPIACSIMAAWTGEVRWTRAQILLFGVAAILAILPDIKHPPVVRIGNWLAGAAALVAVALAVHYLIVPLGLAVVARNFVTVFLFPAVILWIWSDYALSRS
ncbi:MAG: tetratricopeptide repeat protein [Phycisphaerales bacterium]|nr:tetratricopeptide repeat protein [Phycisphaerales bacterium]